MKHVAIILVAMSVALAAEETKTIPPGPTHYMGREIAVTMHFSGAPWLTRESREREEDTKTMLKLLASHIKPGDTVCDMGCGNGFYTLPMSKMAGEKGKVYAVDIQPEMIELLKTRMTAAHAENIVPVVNNEITTGLPDGSCDLMLLVDVYHEFSHPEQMLAAIRRAMKPTGRVMLVEFRGEDIAVPIKPEHKMTKEQINKEWPANGFKLVEQFDGLPWQHVMMFQPDEKKP